MPLASFPAGHDPCVFRAVFAHEPPEQYFPAPQDVLVQEHDLSAPFRAQVGVAAGQVLGLQGSIHPPAPFATWFTGHLQLAEPRAHAVHDPAEHCCPAGHETPAQGSTHLFDRQT